MSSAVNVAKFFGCWFCLIAAVAFIVIGHQPFGFPGVLALIAIAFALAPSSFGGS